jgi:hypothetical protein
MNAAIILIQEEIEALRERAKDARRGTNEAQGISVALVELGDALDVLRGLDKSTTGR